MNNAYAFSDKFPTGVYYDVPYKKKNNNIKTLRVNKNKHETEIRKDYHGNHNNVIVQVYYMYYECAFYIMYYYYFFLCTKAVMKII